MSIPSGHAVPGRSRRTYLLAHAPSFPLAARAAEAGELRRTDRVVARAQRRIARCVRRWGRAQDALASLDDGARPLVGGHLVGVAAGLAALQTLVAALALLATDAGRGVPALLLGALIGSTAAAVGALAWTTGTDVGRRRARLRARRRRCRERAILILHRAEHAVARRHRRADERVLHAAALRGCPDPVADEPVDGLRMIGGCFAGELQPLEVLVARMPRNP